MLDVDSGKKGAVLEMLQSPQCIEDMCKSTVVDFMVFKKISPDETLTGMQAAELLIEYGRNIVASTLSAVLVVDDAKHSDPGKAN